MSYNNITISRFDGDYDVIVDDNYTLETALADGHQKIGLMPGIHTVATTTAMADGDDFLFQGLGNDRTDVIIECTDELFDANLLTAWTETSETNSAWIYTEKKGTAGYFAKNDILFAAGNQITSTTTDLGTTDTTAKPPAPTFAIAINQSPVSRS